jgi:NADPH:quinone reductase-like Zn-dependent oxidoreductase
VPEQKLVREGSSQRVGVFAEKVLAVTGGRGVDVVIDLVGAAYFRDSIESTAPLGRIVLVGLSAGAKAEIALGDVLRKRLTLVGTVLRARPLEEKIEAARMLEHNIVPWLADRRVRSVVDRVFAFSEAKEAHNHVAANASFGKVLLAIDDAVLARP